MKTKENRIYLVASVDPATPSSRLIEAASKSAALAYAVRTTLTVELASQWELVDLIGNLVEVEVAEDTTGDLLKQSDG